VVVVAGVSWLDVPAAATGPVLLVGAVAAAGARYTVSCLFGVTAILMMRLSTYAARGWEWPTWNK
jgi:hypothetical protein